MFCRNCGIEISDGSNFCQKCGYRVNDDLENVEKEQTQRAKKDNLAKIAKLGVFFSIIANLLPIGLGINQFIQAGFVTFVVFIGAICSVLAVLLSSIAIVKLIIKQKKDCVKENKFKISVIAIAIPIALMVIVVIIGSLRENAISYDRAMKAYEEKKYEEAYELFSSLDNYKDSEDMARDSRYYQAVDYANKREWSEARDIFEVLARENYRSSVNLFFYCHVQVQAYVTANRAENKLVAQLKDPSSYISYGRNFIYNLTDQNETVITLDLTILLDYSAKNSFGGAVRDIYSFDHTVYLNNNFGIHATEGMEILKKSVSRLVADEGKKYTENSTNVENDSSVTTNIGSTEETTEGATSSVENNCANGNHEWIDATCTAPKYCANCQAEEGNILSHNIDTATSKCIYCGEFEYNVDSALKNALDIFKAETNEKNFCNYRICNVYYIEDFCYCSECERGVNTTPYISVVFYYEMEYSEPIRTMAAYGIHKDEKSDNPYEIKSFDIYNVKLRWEASEDELVKIYHTDEIFTINEDELVKFDKELYESEYDISFDSYKIVCAKDSGYTVYANSNVDDNGICATWNQKASITVQLEKTEGGYYVYYMNGEVKNYINLIQNGDKVSFVYDTTPKTVYVNSVGANTFYTVFNGEEYYFGAITVDYLIKNVTPVKLEEVDYNNTIFAKFNKASEI